MGLGLPRYQLLPSGYEDLGQCVQLRLSFQLLRYGLELPRYLLLPSDYEDLGQGVEFCVYLSNYCVMAWSCCVICSCRRF